MLEAPGTPRTPAATCWCSVRPCPAAASLSAVLGPLAAPHRTPMMHDQFLGHLLCTGTGPGAHIRSQVSPRRGPQGLERGRHLRTRARGWETLAPGPTSTLVTSHLHSVCTGLPSVHLLPSQSLHLPRGCSPRSLCSLGHGPLHTP